MNLNTFVLPLSGFMKMAIMLTREQTLGDGVTDDTDAINRAINAGNPCNRGCVRPHLILLADLTLTCSPDINNHDSSPSLLPFRHLPHLPVHPARLLHHAPRRRLQTTHPESNLELPGLRPH